MGWNCVVPRKGDVDRNPCFSTTLDLLADVVPRKGDVDRNTTDHWEIPASVQSSPARGTWIEMKTLQKVPVCWRVVPRKGDVDRNVKVVAL